MAPIFKSFSDLGLTEVDSLEAVARTPNSILREAPEQTISGELTVFEIDADGFIEKIVGVGYVPPRRFYANVSDIFYHPFCNIVTRDDEIVFEDTIAEMGRSFEAWPLNHLQLARVGNPQSRETLPKYWEPMILGGHSSFGIFGHFLLDMLPLLVRYRPMLNSGELKIGFFQVKDWIRDFFAVIDVDFDCVQTLAAQPTWFAHAVVSHHHSAKTTQYPCANAEIAYAFLRDRVEDVNLFRRVFFLRGDAVKRLKNEAEVAALFASRGFVVLDPQKFSVEKQAEIMKHAEVFASVFGSGFSLSPLMKPGVGKVIELAPSTIIDYWLRRLLSRFDLEHYSIVYDGEAQTIDVGVLAKILDRILS
ncbi:glycosyltransferase family 61 protein [Methylocystis parvus]|uniref:Glycosyltransferase family 61 protein n=1 Tax=Methylocystis parvus TaxID=134 RepID=A0A6B8LVF3_9HYPH|nr:glycosyltransferase family 61 protein [Methylocystis parvus]QGM96367.1 glycosyltransferase family 61 protein [Methylocystis parvus]WBJ99792.1 glycosyltransferase family 61 protein [Methylocystis parvus OBBP]